MTKARDLANIISGGFTEADIPNLSASKITSGTFADARLAASNITQHVTPTDLQPLKSDISALALREATNESSAAFNLPNQFIDTLTNATNLGTQTNGALGSGYWATDFVALTSHAGNETPITDGDYTVLKWISTSGTKNIILGSSLVVDYLVVGGGGGAGGSAGDFTAGGGGGGGAYRYATSQTLAAGTHSITVGAGGTGGADYGTAGTNGGDSILGSITANGGGFGGSYSVGSVGDSVNGSGGGGGVSGSSVNRDGGTSGAYGNDGGDGLAYGGWGSKSAGGGGGAGGAGADGSGGTGGAGGAGSSNSITGSSQTYSSGGGGAGHSSGGAGGTNAANGASGEGNGNNATANFGGGGGGSCVNTGGARAGGNGGSGIVIVRYLTANASGTNATGEIIQTANTVSSAKTKVGGTFLYKDLHGTNTLGTDLKIYFSCNGGSNWTEASSYSAITPVYSTGIKQVRLGETTCTSGTDVRYKAVWANQSAGSKVAQLHGIGINY